MTTNCNIDLSLKKIQEDLINGKNSLNQIKSNIDKMTHHELAQCFSKLRGIVGTNLVSGKDLPISGYLLDSNGKVSRYVWLDSSGNVTDQVAFPERSTDKTKIADAIKYTKEASEATSALPDNIIKRDMGTAIHELAQVLMEEFIENDTEGIIEKNSKDPNYKVIKAADINKFAKDRGISEGLRKSLEKGVKEIFEQVKDKQKALNKKSGVKDTAYIFTEQLAFSKKLGTTIDLLYILSNKSVGVFDYKTITPKGGERGSLSPEGKIISDNWIHPQKLLGISLQLSKINEILKDELGLVVNDIRAVPVQLQFKLKPEKKTWKKGAYILPELEVLRIGKESSEYLKQIPIISEKFDSKELNEALSKLLILKNNVLEELASLGTTSSVKKTALEGRLKSIQAQINSIQIDRDVTGIYDLWQDIVNRYSVFEEGSYRLKNVDDKFIEGKTEEGEDIKLTNKNYMSLEDLRDLRDSITTLLSIINSTEEFMKELNVKDPAKLARLRVIEAEYTKRATVMISDLKERILNRVLTSEQIQELDDSHQLGMLAWNFNRASEQHNVLIQEYSRLVALANDRKRLSVQALEADLNSVMLPLQQWGKRNGKKGFSMYDMLIDKKSGDLIQNLTPDFFKYLKNQGVRAKGAESTKDFKDNILKYYTLKDDAKATQEKIIDSYKRNNNPSEQQLDEFKKRWDLRSDFVVFNRINTFYKLDESKIEDTYFTAEYKELLKPQNKEVLDFYRFWNKHMYSLLHDLEVYGQGKHYSNFIPWLQADATELIQRDGVGAAWNSAKESVRIATGMEHQLDDTEMGDTFVKGKINPETGEQLRMVPRFFLNPIYNNEGKIDTTLKSMDLGRSLLEFADMAYNYKYKSTIEPILESLKDIALTDVAAVVASERNIKFPGGDIHKYKGPKNEIFEYLDKMIKYNVYGLHYGADLDAKAVKVVRTIFELDRYNKKRLFGLNLQSAVKAQVASRLAILFEGIKGIYFKREHMSKATSMQSAALVAAMSGKQDENVFIQVAKLFSIHADSITPDRIAKVSMNKFDSIGDVATEDLVNFLGRGDRAVDNMVLVSVMQNYGFKTTKDGKVLTRLNKESTKDLGIKSLLDSAVLKDGKLTIEGIHDKEGKIIYENYTEFRKLAINVATAIKGTLSPEDINMVGINLLGKLFMSLKTFIPALAKERFGSIDYNRTTKEVTFGRYNAALGNFITAIDDNGKNYLESIKDDPNKVESTMGFAGFLLTNFLKNAAAVSYMMLTYGLANAATVGRASNMKTAEWAKKIIIAENRSRAIFDDYKAKYPNSKEIQALEFDDFLHYKLQQARAASVEFTYVVSMMIMLNYMHGLDSDDDKKKDVQEDWKMRFLYRNLMGTYRELSFFVNPLDWSQSLQTVTPIIGLVKNIFQLVGNGWDETTDLIFGEDNKKDKTPIGYYMSKMIPYVNPLARQLELFEEDKNVYGLSW